MRIVANLEQARLGGRKNRKQAKRCLKKRLIKSFWTRGEFGNKFAHRMETWSLQTKKFYDRNGERWYFMFQHRYFFDRPPGEQPYALYFRNDECTVFGVLRFEHSQDNPCSNLEIVARKIMDDAEFQSSLIDEGSKKVWKDR
jgi:hypothetical protein